MTLQSFSQFLDINHSHSLSNCPPLPESILKANRDELDIKLNITNVGEQELPQDLQGHVFIVAPVGTEESNLPHKEGNSFMCGDGMVYRLDFNQLGEVALQTRILKTPDFYADLETANNEEDTGVLLKLVRYIMMLFNFNNHEMLRFSSF